jgi:hypothetical protein
MTELTIRSAFEKWAKRKDMPLLRIIDNRKRDIYKNWCVQDAWEAWQTSWKLSGEYSDDTK